MSLNRIFDDVKTEQIRWSFHAIEQAYQHGMSIEQVYQAILRGTVRKREADEYSDGKYTKYTIVYRRRLAVVKDSTPAFIITVGRME